MVLLVYEEFYSIKDGNFEHTCGEYPSIRVNISKYI